MTTWRDAQKYLSSLWLLDRDDDRSLDFHGAFVPAVAEGLILRHTQPGDSIWDPMAGSGTTGRVAAQLGRQYFLSDLNPTDSTIVEGDARTLRVYSDPHSGMLRLHPTGDDWPPYQFALVILHPPYHDIIKFSEKLGDLSNCGDVTSFYRAFWPVLLNANKHLKPGGYLGLVIGDIWLKGKAEVEPLGFRCADLAVSALDGGRLKSIVVKDIKNNRHNAGRKNLLLSRFFRWGAVDFQHEYIFSIQKGKR